METVAGSMEIVVRGRNVVIPDHYRQHVAEKLAKLERYDHKIIRTDVELQHEKNPRQASVCPRRRRRPFARRLVPFRERHPGTSRSDCL